MTIKVKIILVLLIILFCKAIGSEVKQTNTVTIIILDENGNPTPARIRVTGPDSAYYAPMGHTGDYPITKTGGDVILDRNRRFAYIDGQCTFQLPSAPITYEVVKGFDYRLLKETVFVTRQTDTLKIQLERWFEFPDNIWYSGDIHVHHISPATAMLETKAENLNVCNILTSDFTSDQFNFKGSPDPMSENLHIVYVNQEFREDRLGHTVFLNLKELIEPVKPQRQVQYPLNLMVYDQVHEQGGHVSWAHFVQRMGIEWSLAAVLKKFDSVELLCNMMPFLWAQRQADVLPEWQANSGLKLWYRLLNCGLEVPITAGTDKMTNLVTVGANRVFAAVRGKFTYDSWISALNEGRTFVSNSPFLFLEINGEGPGDRIYLEEGDSISVEVDVWSQLPLDRLEIIANGELIAEKTILANQEHATLFTTYKPRESTWIAARAYQFYAEDMESGVSFATPRQKGGGPTLFNSYYGTILPETTFAHSSPIYVILNNKPIRSAKDAKYFVKHLDNGIQWLQKYGKFPSSDAKKEVLDKFNEGRKEFLNISNDEFENDLEF